MADPQGAGGRTLRLDLLQEWEGFLANALALLMRIGGKEPEARLGELKIFGDAALARLDDTDISQQAQTIANLLEDRIDQTLDEASTPPPASTP